ncbi:hypothetical protein ON010_g9212 [Phytophthora cinnamomi]|nr:hypothetical protein ON010_g9212 [Phytophthora cinnamomi]
MTDQVSSSRACSSPAKAPPVPPTGMRSPTKIRTPTKLVRPRETHWASRAKDVKKRLLEAADGPASSSLPPPQAHQTQLHAAHAAHVVEAVPEPKEDEGYAGYAEGLQRQVEVAQCLEEDLLRDNARLRLKALSLRGEVDFYYGVLARVELVAAQQVREGGEGRSNHQQEQVALLAEQLQRIISASKLVGEAVAAAESGEPSGSYNSGNRRCVSLLLKSTGIAMDEDNVVGALFLQNGEDNGYDPEDFVQELDVGESAPRFRISVADDDGGIPGSLFACAVWNGASPAVARGAALRSGGGDYPNDLLLENMETNIKRNEHLLGSGRREVRGHLWGSDTTGVLKCLDASESTPISFDAVGKESEDSAAETADGVEHSTKNRFDVAVVAECLWLHHLHGDLLKSIDACLAPEGKFLKMSSAPNHADPWGLGRRPTKEEMDRWADEKCGHYAGYVNISAKCLEYVKQHAEAGNPASVIATIDEFASTNHMMNIGPVKGAVIDEEIRKKKPAVMAELGAYTGYSTVRFASLQREVAGPDSHYYSFEYSPVFAARVREMVELAGLTNQVTVYVGEFSEQYEALRGKTVDLYFIDHEKSVYLSDLKLIIGSGTLAPGSIIAADNVVRPGAPDYLEFIENSPQFSTVRHTVLCGHDGKLLPDLSIATFSG